MKRVKKMNVCGLMAGVVIYIRPPSMCPRYIEAKCMVSEGRRYIIDRRTGAVEVQERGRVRGVGPSR